MGRYIRGKLKAKCKIYSLACVNIIFSVLKSHRVFKSQSDYSNTRQHKKRVLVKLNEFYL